MTTILRAGQKTHHLINTIARSYSSKRDVDVRVEVAADRSIMNPRRYFATEKKPQGDWVGRDKVGGDKTIQGPSSENNKAGRDIWKIRISGIGGVIILLGGLLGGGYLLCEKFTDRKACTWIRESLGIKKD